MHSPLSRLSLSLNLSFLSESQGHTERERDTDTESDTAEGQLPLTVLSQRGSRDVRESQTGGWEVGVDEEAAENEEEEEVVRACSVCGWVSPCIAAPRNQTRCCLHVYIHMYMNVYIHSCIYIHIHMYISSLTTRRGKRTICPPLSHPSKKYCVKEGGEAQKMRGIFSRVRRK